MAHVELTVCSLVALIGTPVSKGPSDTRIKGPSCLGNKFMSNAARAAKIEPGALSVRDLEFMADRFGQLLAFVPNSFGKPSSLGFQI